LNLVKKQREFVLVTLLIFSVVFAGLKFNQWTMTGQPLVIEAYDALDVAKTSMNHEEKLLAMTRVYDITGDDDALLVVTMMNDYPCDVYMMLKAHELSQSISLRGWACDYMNHVVGWMWAQTFLFLSFILHPLNLYYGYRLDKTDIDSVRLETLLFGIPYTIIIGSIIFMWYPLTLTFF